ncbi:ion channel TACAN isoform X3 [Parasteatoda tepidariorum]|uniref:ion channel TACAN isoform X3 n=1 Tax=Parasteatoda tepidariorum TaxID=114398 RepID=UPI0039BD5DD0
MNIENLLALKKEWDLLTKEYGDLEVHEKQYEKAVEDLGKCQNACSKSLAHQWYRLKQISEEIKKCGATSKEEIDLIESLKQEIELRKVQLDDIQSNLPRSNGLYLRIILGGVNVTIVNKEDSKKYKEEYERFKVTVTIIILILSAQSILFSYRIKGWWRVNHFITCIQAGVIIVWPDGVMYDQFRKQFTLYTCYTSILQFLQFNYQQGCLYRLRALGERHKMDITIEGFHSWMWRGLTFLLPFLYFGYIFQLYNAYTLFNLSKDEQCVEWQVFVSAVIFFMLFVGNTLTTSRVLHQKLTEKIINSLNTVGEKETTKKSN